MIKIKNSMTNMLLFLKQHPIVGIISGLSTWIMDFKDVFSALGVIFGTLIAAVTLYIKIIELIDKLKARKQKKLED